MRSKLWGLLAVVFVSVLILCLLWLPTLLPSFSPIDQALRKVEKGKEPKERLAAILELQKTVKEKNLSPEQKERIVQKILQVADSDTDERVRSASLSLLLLLGLRDKSFQKVLVNALRRSPQEASLAVELLPQVADEPTWLSLMEMFENEVDPTTQDRLIRVLCKMPTGVWDELCKRLSENPQRWQPVINKLPSPPMSVREDLIQLALSKSIDTCKGALILLVRFPPSPEGSEKLRSLVNSRDETVRTLVFSIWSRSPSKALIPELRKGLSGEPEIAYFASVALLRLGALQPKEGRELLRQPYAPLRAQGALALATSNLASDFQALEKALKDPDPEVVRNAAVALAAKGAEGITTLLRVYENEKAPERRAAMLMGMAGVSHPKVIAALVRALRFGDWREKGAALAGITFHKDKSLPALEQLTKSSNKRDRLAVIDALNAIKTTDALRLLLKIARSDPDEEVRCEALLVLSNHGVKEALPLLVDLMEKGSSPIVNTAAMGLARYGEEGRSLLRQLLKSEREATRRAAARALATLNDRASLDFLKEQADTTDIRQRIANLQLMARVGDEKALRELISFLTHEEPTIRLRARLSLYSVGKQAIPSLLHALDSPDSRIRAEAALVLGALKATAAREKLASLLKDEDEQVREAARQALNRLEESGM
ncbi:MAG: HEAT repeat domain-containing protein [Armatimonadetes bacterium]|nr:HEAT repeat domain-containing protein [Armatimonadota bacterium]